MSAQTQAPETHENNNTVENLRQQILEKRELQKQEKIRDQKEQEKLNALSERETEEVHVRRPSNDRKEVDEGSEGEGGEGSEADEKAAHFRFKKGDKHFDVDEDAEFEFTADKRPIKMTLKQMRDAAAGGIAVRDRMRRIAEEKKALYEPFKGFREQAKKDPLASLEKMFRVIGTVDPDVDYNEFLTDLAKQAQEVAKMEPNARKAQQLEKQIAEKDEELSETKQLNRIGELKSELMEQTGLSEEKIYEFGQHILNNPILSEGIEDEEDLMNRIGDLAEEIEMQKASFEALRKVKSDISHKDPLIFELTRLLKANPDFDEQDLQEIAEEVLNSVHKAKASQKLSKKQRWTSTGTRQSGSKPDGTPDFSRMKPVDALMWQAKHKKQQQQQNLAHKRI